jgi:hypothetical protein
MAGVGEFAEIDMTFADLGLGYTDAAIMALAERDRLPVLTFDFEHFRATRPAHGFWELVVDEHRYQQHIGARPGRAVSRSCSV